MTGECTYSLAFTNTFLQGVENEVIIRTMVHNLQHVSAEAAVTQIHVYTSLPELVVNLNVEEFHDLPLSESEMIDETLRTMWKQTTQLFPEVGCKSC